VVVEEEEEAEEEEQQARHCDDEKIGGSFKQMREPKKEEFVQKKTRRLWLLKNICVLCYVSLLFLFLCLYKMLIFCLYLQASNTPFTSSSLSNLPLPFLHFLKSVVHSLSLLPQSQTQTTPLLLCLTQQSSISKAACSLPLQQQHQKQELSSPPLRPSCPKYE